MSFFWSNNKTKKITKYIDLGDYIPFFSFNCCITFVSLVPCQNINEVLKKSNMASVQVCRPRQMPIRKTQTNGEMGTNFSKAKRHKLESQNYNKYQFMILNIGHVSIFVKVITKDIEKVL